MKSKILTGVNENDGLSYKFHENEIKNIGLTPEYRKDLQLVATILACNVEEPTIEQDGTVDIDERMNFNDSYYDMMADLRGVDEDFEEDDE